MNRFTTMIMISALALGYQLANAAPAPEAPSVTVHFADLNLSHSEGIAVLYRRLKGGAKSVCALQDGRDVASQMRFKECWQSALGRAVAKIDQPVLTAYYRGQFKGRNATIQIAQNAK